MKAPLTLIYFYGIFFTYRIILNTPVSQLYLLSVL